MKGLNNGTRDAGTMKPTGKSAPETGQSCSRSRKREPVRILMAEDDPDMRRMLADILRSKGYEVEAAENGWVAWNILQARSFHLLLTDNHMDRLTGMGLIRKMDAAGMDLPVILATAAKPAEKLQDPPWLNIEILLLKPFTAEELMGAVERVVGRTRNSMAGRVPAGESGEGAAWADHPDAKQ